jgi:hypothetical protein
MPWEYRALLGVRLGKSHQNDKTAAESRDLFGIRFKRLLAAAAEPILPLLAVVIVGIGYVFQQSCAPPLLLILLYAILTVGLIAWLAKTWSGYIRITHDPTWALTYQNTWDSDDGYRRRRVAAVAIETYKADLTNVRDYGTKLSDIDDALDILEDIGFYVFGGQISPEAAHHHFFYWIQGYWCCVVDYVKSIQVDDPTRWENLERLFNVTSVVEIQRSRRKLSADKLWLTDVRKHEFLDEEKDLPGAR